jgi:hypothetical protein
MSENLPMSKAGTPRAPGRLSRRGGPGSIRATLCVLLGSLALLAIAPIAGAQASGTIKGAVTEAGGAKGPVNGAQVEALNPASGESVSFATTNAEGKYELLVAPGSYKVRFSPPSGSKLITQFYNGKGSLATAEALLVNEGETKEGINAKLGEGGTISGTVLKEGTPAGGIEVDVFPRGSNESFFFRSTTTGADGTYSVTGVPEGSYTVDFFPQFGENLIAQAYNEQQSLSKAEPVIVGFEQARPEINANLQVGGVISGRVTDAATHKGLAEVSVSATRVGVEAFGFAETNSNGEYTMVGLPSGTYNLEFESFASGSGYMTLTDNGVGVTQKSTTSGINVSLTPNTPNNTSVPVASGTPLVGQTLSCSTGSWTGLATLKYSYQWIRDGSAITGATTSAYLVAAADQGHGLACQVTATNAKGHSTATSNTLAVSAAVPPKPLVPVIKILTSKVVVTGSAARVRLSCVAAPCAGTVELIQQVVTRTHKGHRTIVRRKTIVLGRGVYALAAGRTGSVTIRLNTTGRRRLARARGHRLLATLVVTVKGGKTARQAVLLTKAAARHKAKH